MLADTGVRKVAIRLLEMSTGGIVQGVIYECPNAGVPEKGAPNSPSPYTLSNIRLGQTFVSTTLTYPRRGTFVGYLLEPLVCPQVLRSASLSYVN
jgi:hypothetical protein